MNRLVRPTTWILNKPRSTFQICSCIGLGLSHWLALTLVAQQRLSLWVMAAVMLSTVATFLTVAMVTKIIVGEERLVYYHHGIGVITVAALLLRMLGQPMLAYFDITILGIGLFLACGRIGCLMVGCCHGRPHRWGVRYSEYHAKEGFTSSYVGTRLFPVQLVESITVLMIVIVGVGMVLSRGQPGEELTWYVMSYGIARFFLEFKRGDPARPYWLGFSEAQWTSVLLMSIVSGLEIAGTLPHQFWHLPLTAVLALAVTCIAIRRSQDKRKLYRLRTPRHEVELVHALEFLPQVDAKDKASRFPAPGTQTVNVATTSLGLRVSCGRVAGDDGMTHHYTFSLERGELPVSIAQGLARLVAQVKHANQANRLMYGGGGTFHLLAFPMPTAADRIVRLEESSAESGRDQALKGHALVTS